MKEMPCMSFSSLVYICLILPFTLLERKQKRKKKCVVSEILQGGSKMTSTSENRPFFFVCVCSSRFTSEKIDAHKRKSVPFWCVFAPYR